MKITRNTRPRNEEELAQCLQSRWWTLNNLHAISPKSGSIVPFWANSVQTKFQGIYHWINFVLKSRQHGLSTFCVLFILDRLLFEENKTGGVIDIKLPDAQKKLGMAKLSYDNMDNPEVHPESWEFTNKEGKVGTIAMWEIGALVKKDVRLIKGDRSPSPQELVFSNGSKFYSGTSFRGGTLQYGLFTEFGKVAHKFPERAQEIVDGAENAMHEGSIAFYETTMEGGKVGLAWEKADAAMKNSRDKADLTRLDQLFVFFGWFEDSANQLDDTQARLTLNRYRNVEEIDTLSGKFLWREYFFGDGDKKEGAIARVLKEHGHQLTDNQVAWYLKKRISQGWAMLKEHPTFPEEAFQAPVTGAIYAEAVLRAKAEERVSVFQPDRGRLVHTTWDIGSNQNTVVVYWQKKGPTWYVIDCDSDLDLTTGERVGYMQRKGYNYGSHCLPHDGAHQKIGELTYEQILKDHGLQNVKVIPVTSSVTLRIDGMHERLPNIHFNETKCEKLLLALETYRYKQDKDGDWITDIIVKDWTNHFADAFGYLWEADQASLLQESLASHHVPNQGGVVRRRVQAGGLSGRR